MDAYEPDEADLADREQDERDRIFDWPTPPPPFAAATDGVGDLQIPEDPKPMTPRALLGVPNPMRAPFFGGSDEDGL